MNNRRDLPDSGPGFQRCHGLAAYLRALIPSPKRGDPITEPLRLLVFERLGRTPRLYREIVGCGAVDDNGLAWAWHAAAGIVEGFKYASNRRRHFAEEHARVQILALHKHCLSKIDSLQGHVYLLDDDGEGIRVLDEYRLLAGILALCLLEAGDVVGRRDVREAAAECLDEEDTAGPIRVLLGLSGYPSDDTWRPGQGCLGVFRNAVSDGHKSLLGTVADTLKEDVREKRAKPGSVDSLHDILTQVPAPPPAPVQIDTGPSLLVLASVEHLPGSAKDGDGKPGRATATNPRSEWAPYAGRRWPLVRVPDLSEARAELLGEFPYAESLIEAVLSDLAGRPHVFVRPLLLVGAPGSGKTRLARRIAEVLGLGWQVHGCSGASDSTILSTSRQWSTGRASTPLQLLKRLGAASALLVLDELDKVGTGSQNGNLLDAILPLLTDDASRFWDSFLEAVTDLSGVSYIATANDLTALRRSHAALLDRFRIHQVPSPRPQDLPVVLRTILADLRAERGLDEDWCPDFDGEEVALIEQHFRKGGSLRLVRRLAETVLAGREALATRN